MDICKSAGWEVGKLDFDSCAKKSRSFQIGQPNLSSSEMINRLLIVIAVCLALPLHAQAELSWYEVRAQELLGGELEVHLENRTRCDLLTDTHAYEIKYARDWKDSIGRAMHYDHMTTKQPGIVLMCSGMSETLPGAAQGHH